MMRNEFSLQITSRDSREVVTYERCSAICEYRSQILEKASQMGGTVGPTSSYILVPTSEKLHELVRYIENLMFPSNVNTVTITVRGKFFASFPRTSKMYTFREALLVQMSTHHGTETEYGFSFNNPYEASLFTAKLATNYTF